MLRRFTRRVQQSGILIRAKRGRFYERPKNKRAMREDALRRKVIKERKDFLRKIGKLEEFDRRGPRGRKPLRALLRIPSK